MGADFAWGIDLQLFGWKNCNILHSCLIFFKFIFISWISNIHFIIRTSDIVASMVSTYSTSNLDCDYRRQIQGNLLQFNP